MTAVTYDTGTKVMTRVSEEFLADTFHRETEGCVVCQVVGYVTGRVSVKAVVDAKRKR